ncbi:MAG: esterase family protein [Chloroflexi bacterium]|nr:esterase family protein [Chloroflexota bacterium]HEV8053432.1 alpha/beta fold hydrolase [Candidatus Limnocylindrales bacterium]
MQVETHTWWSPVLDEEMECREYGHAGQPLLGFPSFGGRVWDLEGFGMVDALGPLIEAGRVRLFAVDGIDRQSWADRSVTLPARGRRHEAFDRYLADELTPFIQQRSGRPALWSMGCSMGGYHAANLFFRHPDRFDGVIALSGVYRPPGSDDGEVDEAFYFNSPLDFLPGLDDRWYLDRYRASRMVFAVGQGAWEDPCLADTRELQRILEAKRIPAWFDYWGHDVDHDWSSWHRMLPYFLDALGAG